MKMQKHLLALAAGLLCAGVHAMEETKFEVLAKLLVNGRIKKWQSFSEDTNKNQAPNAVHIGYNKNRVMLSAKISLLDGNPILSGSLIVTQPAKNFHDNDQCFRADMNDEKIDWDKIHGFVAKSDDKFSTARFELRVRKLAEEDDNEFGFPRGE